MRADLRVRETALLLLDVDQRAVVALGALELVARWSGARCEHEDPDVVDQHRGAARVAVAAGLDEPAGDPRRRPVRACSRSIEKPAIGREGWNASIASADRMSAFNGVRPRNATASSSRVMAGAAEEGGVRELQDLRRHHDVLFDERAASPMRRPGRAAARSAAVEPRHAGSRTAEVAETRSSSCSTREDLARALDDPCSSRCRTAC